MARARAALASGRPELCAFELTAEATGADGLVCGGTVRAFVEPLEPPPTLLLFGAGHVSAALARLARPSDSASRWPTTGPSRPAASTFPMPTGWSSSACDRGRLPDEPGPERLRRGGDSGHRQRH